MTDTELLTALDPYYASLRAWDKQVYLSASLRHRPHGRALKPAQRLLLERTLAALQQRVPHTWIGNDNDNDGETD